MKLYIISMVLFIAYMNHLSSDYQFINNSKLKIMQRKIELHPRHFILDTTTILARTQYGDPWDCPVYRAFNEQYPGVITGVINHGWIQTKSGNWEKPEEYYDVVKYEKLGFEFINGRTEPYTLTYNF